jgi:transposase
MVIRVRDLTLEEGEKLRRVVRHGQDAIEFKRAQVILASAQGHSPPKISIITLTSEDYIRELIHAFNEHGMAVLKPKWGPGRPSRFTEEQRKGLVDLATSRPRELGLPYAEWSLTRLREEAIKRGVVETISEEWLRVLLHEAEVSHQSIRTWKQSTDPEFAKKKKVIDWLTNQSHNPPIVLSADEIGPIQLIPHGGQGWFEKGRPGRIPAEYSKENGTVYYFLGLNVFHQKLWGKVYRTKHSVNWLEFLQQLRAGYPADQLVWLIQDNASPHWTAEVRAWASANRMVLVASPTRASWLNPVECHAGDLQRLALTGEAFTTPGEVGAALDACVTYRNTERKARGKRFRDTMRKDRRRRPKIPVWKRAS